MSYEEYAGMCFVGLAEHGVGLRCLGGIGDGGHYWNGTGRSWLSCGPWSVCFGAAFRSFHSPIDDKETQLGIRYMHFLLANFNFLYCAHVINSNFAAYVWRFA